MKPVRLFWLISPYQLLEPEWGDIEVWRNHLLGSRPNPEAEVRLKWMREVKHPELLPPEIAVRVEECGRLFRLCEGRDNHPLVGDLFDAEHALRLACANPRLHDAIVVRHRIEFPGCPYDYTENCLKWTPTK